MSFHSHFPFHRLPDLTCGPAPEAVAQNRRLDVAFVEGDWDPRALTVLKPGGVLLWAFENPLSICAFAGSRDAGGDSVYRTLCGTAPTPRERREQAAAEGLTLLEEHLLFPGLRDATTVVSRDLAVSEPLLAARIAASSLQPLAGMPRVLGFPESLALVHAARGGMLTELAPAVLLVLTRDPGGPTARRLLEFQNRLGERAWHQSFSRRIPSRTVIRKGADGTLVSIKLPQDETLASPLRLTPGLQTDSAAPAPASFQVEWTFGQEEPVRRGLPLSEELQGLLHAARWPEFEARLKHFVRTALDALRAPDGGLLPHALDATLVNALWNDARQTWDFIDLEWRLAEGSPAMRPTWFVLRNVLVLARNFEFFSPECPFVSLRALYERICGGLGLAADFDADVLLESRFQSLTSSGGDWRDHAGRIRLNLEHRFDVEWLPRLATRELEMRSRYPRLALESATFVSRAARKAQKLIGHPAFRERR